MDKNELLQFAVDNDMIDMASLEKMIAMNEKTKYLNMHKYKIWSNASGQWYTYLPDANRNNNRRLVKKSSEATLINTIVKYYKEQEKRITITDVFYEWITNKLRYGEIKKQSYDRYITDFNRFFGNKKISEMDFSHISEGILEDFIKTSIKENELTAKSWSGLRLIIRGVFKYGKKHGYTQISITNFLGDLDLSNNTFKKTHHKSTESVFTDNEILQITNYVLEHADNVVNLGVLLAFQTGLRVGELSALCWSDVDGDILHVNKTEVHYRDEDNKYVYEVQKFAKTDAGDRDVLLSDSAKAILDNIKRLGKTDKYIFMRNGERIKEKAFSVKIVKICNQLGITPRSLHKVRKTYATKLINSGVDESLIINQIGHTDISTTKQFYYFNNKTKEEAKKQIQDAIEFK
jgi:integrase